jgi:hypothetical protein
MIAPYAAAQRASSGAHASAAHVAPARTALHSTTPAAHFPRARNGYPFASRRSSPLTSLPFPFLADSFNPDDIYSSGYPVASDPPPFLMQAMQQFAGAGLGSMGQSSIGKALSAPRNQPSSSDPLMIELQNGQYVRVNNTAIDGEALPLKLAPDHSQTNSARPPMISAISPKPLPAAVLIFRDGHTEEVRDYTIADGILYARGDYYTDGYWNKKIALTTLNVSQTLQANATRNVNFVLPSSPNEVITRP